MIKKNRLKINNERIEVSDTPSESKIKTTREIKGVIVPFGNEMVLSANTEVVITQALGGSYTIIANGEMIRVTKEYADALGQEVLVAENTSESQTLEERIWNELKTCYDPEIPVNIVDLGLIYGVELNAVEDGHDVKIKMTLTAPGCGMGPIIAAEAEHKVRALVGTKQVVIEFVFDPPWDRSRMSDQARLELGMM